MLAKLLIDFGLVILIWMTQLVVYPSFTHFGQDELFSWHQKYTTAISMIVMPLMLGQVISHGYFLYSDFDILKLIAAILIGIAWINTFFYAVPLHNKISFGQEIIESAKGLVKLNWLRTFLWSGVFLLSLFDYLKNQG
ncbi:hypothetical protein [Ekhidna sp.]|uniref:hypothetical protein n=1 Tax=Ekhidna sp. TaxID=2608089 RepID=UPI003CCC270B